MAAWCALPACGLVTVPPIQDPSVRFNATGVARLYVNELETRAVGFEVRQGEKSGSLEMLYDEPLMDFGSQTATFPGNDVVLTDPCRDGFVARFARVP
jgi:hypothetical protein